MKLFIKITFFAIIFTIIVLVQIAKADEPELGSISGIIFSINTGERVPYAAIELVDGLIGGVSNENGEYFLLNVPAGEYDLRVSLLGYKKITKKVNIVGDQQLIIDLYIKELPTPLAKININSPIGSSQHVENTNFKLNSNYDYEFLFIGLPVLSGFNNIFMESTLRGWWNIIKRILVTLVIIIFYFPTLSEGGIFFNYPRNGHFKFQSPQEDKWYFIDQKDWYVKAPDKWQHYFSNYASSMLLVNKIGLIPTLSILTMANIAKEMEDGYREGFSVRDLTVGSAGMLAGALKRNFICYYDNEKILIIFYFRI